MEPVKSFSSVAKEENVEITIFYIKTQFIRKSRLDLPKNKNNVRKFPAQNEKLQEKLLVLKVLKACQRMLL